MTSREIGIGRTYCVGAKLIHKDDGHEHIIVGACYCTIDKKFYFCLWHPELPLDDLNSVYEDVSLDWVQENFYLA